MLHATSLEQLIKFLIVVCNLFLATNYNLKLKLFFGVIREDINWNCICEIFHWPKSSIENK